MTQSSSKGSKMDEVQQTAKQSQIHARMKIYLEEKETNLINEFKRHQVEEALQCRIASTMKSDVETQRRTIATLNERMQSIPNRGNFV